MVMLVPFVKIDQDPLTDKNKAGPLKTLRWTLHLIIPVDHDRDGEDQREDAGHGAHWPHQLARARLGLLGSYSTNFDEFSLT